MVGAALAFPERLVVISSIESNRYMASSVTIFMMAAPLVRLKILALGHRRYARRKETVLIRFASPR